MGGTKGASKGPAPPPVRLGVKGAATATRTWPRVVTQPTPMIADVIGRPVTVVATRARAARDFDELAKAYEAGRCLMPQTRSGAVRVHLDSMAEAAARFGLQAFFGELLPFVCEEALAYPQRFPEPPIMINTSQNVTWTRRQCLCILCNAFLCSWPGRLSLNSMSVDGKMPSINFDEFLVPEVPEGRNAVCVSKVEMFLHYLVKQRRRLQNGFSLTAPVTFLRQACLLRSPWRMSLVRLCEFQMQPLGQSIDDAKDMLRADFANRVLGGGCLDTGCAQEEIMFMCHPEMICGRLVFPAMEDDEAIIIIGTEQFSDPAGYGFDLTCAGASDDPQAADPSAQVRSFVTAIDACDYRGGDPTRQFSRSYLERELGKAVAGFSLPEGIGGPQQLATGNWGAGAFRGDAGLKALIQWAAASVAGIESIAYFPWDDVAITEDLPAVVDKLQSRSVADLYELMLRLSDEPLHPPCLKRILSLL